MKKEQKSKNTDNIKHEIGVALVALGATILVIMF